MFLSWFELCFAELCVDLTCVFGRRRTFYRYFGNLSWRA